MKTILLLSMLFAVSAQAGVSVTINGTTYACSDESSTNLCECLVQPNGRGGSYVQLYKRGKELKATTIDGSVERGQKFCTDWKMMTPACY